MPGILTPAGYVGADMDGPCEFKNPQDFHQYDGPFTFPNWALRDGAQLPAGEGFYRQERVSGTNRCKTAANAWYPGLTACVIGAVGPFGTVIEGVFQTDFGGEYTYDADFSGNATGELQVDAALEGMAPGPKAWPPGSERTINANSMDTLLALMASQGIPFCSERYETEFYNDQYVRRWINWNDPMGWFAGRGTNINWCVAYEVHSFYTLKIGPDEI